MKIILKLLLTIAFTFANAVGNEDQNLSRFEKAFPEAKHLEVPNGAIFQRYSLPAKISIVDLTKRLEQAFGGKIKLLSADDPSVCPTSADFKDFAVAKLLMSGDTHLGLITKTKESDDSYTVGIIMDIKVEMDPGSSANKERSTGRNSDIDMKLPP